MLAKILDAFSTFSDTWHAKQFGAKERIQCYESLVALLENGINLDQALERVGAIYQEKSRKARHPIALACQGIGQGVRNGQSLAEACEGWMPYQERAVVGAGERSGNLIQAFHDAVRMIEASQHMRSLILGAAFYPVITWALMAYLLHVIAARVIPAMKRASDPESWSGASALLYHLATYVNDWGLLTLIVAVVVIVLSLVSLPYLTGPLRRPLEVLPPWSIYKSLHGSTFLLNMAVMLRSNINQLEALEILMKGANPWLRERLVAAHYGVRQGKNFGVALQLAGHGFPDPMAIQFLVALSTTGSFATAIHRYSLRWLETSLKQVAGMTKSLSTVSTILIGCLMILVMIGTYSLTGSATAAR